MESLEKLQLLVLSLGFLFGVTSCQSHLLQSKIPTESVSSTPHFVSSATINVTTQVTSIVTATSPIQATPMATATSTPYIPQFPVFGVGIDHLNPSGGLDQMASAGMSWVRPQGIEWSSIEPTEGTYNWNVLASLDTELKNASDKGMQVILLVHSTPQWARKDGGTGAWCGPMAADKLSTFGDFMHELVTRLSAIPYSVKYWEMWNEEDVTSSIFAGDSGYGCWGDSSDTYFGGGYYAEMLKAVYPAIKSADPQAQVLIGGLLLDCDPGGGCADVGHDPKLPMFLEGILQKYGGDYFDGISFHAYDYYHQSATGQGYYDNFNWRSTWNTAGPVTIAKTQFIQSLLTKYGINGKYLMNTETALVCGTNGRATRCLTDEFSNTKNNYVAEVYAASIAQGLRANLWYSALGWRGSALLGGNLTPLPAYFALQFSRTELGGAAWVRDINGYTSVKGYEYNRGDRRIWVLWSLDGNTHTIALTGTPLAARDVLGKSVTPAASMDVTSSPLYLEWNP